MIFYAILLSKNQPKGVSMMYLLLVAITCLSLHISAMEQKATNKNNKVDVKTFLKDQHVNKKNAQGNTFFYELAKNCSAYSYWEEVVPELENYMKNHQGYAPNPFMPHEKIINNEKTYNTAKEEALLQFANTGNPVCGFLSEVYSEFEVMFFDLSGSQEGRKQMISGTVPNQRKSR